MDKELRDELYELSVTLNQLNEALCMLEKAQAALKRSLTALIERLFNELETERKKNG